MGFSFRVNCGGIFCIKCLIYKGHTSSTHTVMLGGVPMKVYRVVIELNLPM